MRVKEFKLRRGMADDELLAELKGKVSGETGQELVAFYTVQNEEKLPDFKDWPGKKFEIVQEDGEFALLLKYEVVEKETITGVERIGKLALPNKFNKFMELRKIHFMAGINDEGKYFVHRLEGIPEEAAKTIETAMAWMNRHDEGFIKRVQGDILIAFVPESAFREQTARDFAIERDVMRMEFTLSRADIARLRAMGSGLRGINAVVFEYPPKITCYASELDPKTYQQISLGNHRVSTDGTIRVLQDRLLLISGDQVVIQHPEHGIVTQDIPRNHLLLMTGQRGRGLPVEGGLEVSIRNQAGFD